MTRLKIFAFVFAVLGSPLAAEDKVSTITVHGRGEVAAAPDMATITLGAEAQAKTADAALTATSKATAEVLDILRGAGVAETDMQTSDLSLNPVWDNRRYEDNRPPRVVGYNASNTLRVRVRELGQLGTILDAVVKGGATTFRGLSFGLQEPEPLADLARLDAVDDARRKANLYAQAAGVSLGPVISIVEGGGVAAPVNMRVAEMAMAAVPVAEGEVSTMAQVTIVYALVTEND